MFEKPKKQPILNNEQRKEQISADAEMYESMLQAEVSSMKAVLTKGVIIAGILTGGYAVSRMLTSSGEKSKNEQIEPQSSNFTKLALGILTPIALKFAQEKFSNLFDKNSTDETNAT